MTPSHAETPSGGSAAPSAAEVAGELHRYMRDAPGTQTSGGICEIVDRLCFAPSLTAKDALAVMPLMDGFLAGALEQMPDEAISSRHNPRFLVVLARVLAQKAIAALETTTGIPLEAYDCERRTTN